MAYKQLNAPLGEVGNSSLVAANHATTGDNKSYQKYLKAISRFTAARDALAAQMKAVLDASVNSSLSPATARGAEDLVKRALEMINQSRDIATGRMKTDQS